ncbi:MAG: FKBP-type peptidyl-prolyl cis-trans isomerase [Nocardioides sp.]
MSSRLHRPALALIPVLLLPTLVACGGSDDNAKDGATGTGLSQVSFTGDVGKEITATWNKPVAKPTSTSVTTLVKGSGDKIAADDTVNAYLWIADGTTKKQTFSDYDQGKPEALPNNGQLGAVFDKLFAGQTYGSRVVAVTTPEDLLGSADAASQLGLGKNDSLVVVADLVEKAAVSPTPTDDKVHDVSPSMMPKIISKNGLPTGLDFSGLSEPDLTTPVHRLFLKKGTGKKVTANSKVTINYLGATYGAKEPFDESYSKAPYTNTLTSLVKGWQIGLEGVPVGSRVLLAMPPAFGYGAQGSGDKIAGNATLWFVIDVLKAS